LKNQKKQREFIYIYVDFFTIIIFVE